MPIPVILAALAALTLAGVLVAAVTVQHSGTVARAAASTSASPSAQATATWQRKSYRRIGYDKSYKADLIDELPSAVELVVFGGSRARRFEPSFLTGLTGLSSFNCAVQCFRPEDAWAFSSYLYARSPDAKLRCVIALQARTFQDDTMRAGLLYDSRLARAFPDDLVAAQKAKLGKVKAKQLLGANRFTARGYLRRNRYDATRALAKYSYSRHLALYIKRQRSNHRWKGALADTRARQYFEKTVRLYNEHGVTPLIIVMPYQPRTLKAFRKVGFQKYLNRLTAYLDKASTRCTFRVLDLTNIKTFGGKARDFYDGVHITRNNARRIARYAVRKAPECFK